MFCGRVSYREAINMKFGLQKKKKKNKEGVRVKSWCDISCLRGENDKNKNPGIEINLGFCELYEISIEPKIGYEVKELKGDQ